MNTTAILAVAAIGFAVSAVSGYFLIPYLHKLHFGQTILDIGPSWHKNKQGTPTMGGFIFIFAILIASVVGYFMLSQGENDLWHGTQVEIARYWGTILLAVSFGIIGFVDDYIKVVKKRNLGLTAIQKLIMQFVAAGLYMLILYTAGDTSTVLIIPFLGQLDLGLVYFPLCVVGIVYITNSVNLTDGLDGLCGSVTCVSALGFMMVSAAMGFGGINLLSTALAAACLGFLVWNFYPAKVFMGDTGSMFLGGMVTGLAFGVGMPLILAFLGIIYICESMSVVLQVVSFKTTGKRIFKMSPIHHHFEMCGLSEVKIDFAFSAVTAVGAVLAVLAVRFI
ncbi:phospho-N-acetylmuramoyl-pentapeptide-transferase [Hydrogenoanaerobacterium saccharovorans]|uniref:Phospho-N-acetylmuramoyl-pentapeptide-transferase n=1 Tax=Hydrogenoanaerobacterium saccharovorans TaxID=474960 RepID=A0ABS2GKX2_9FIRM|nr:phospho-N-acetylmuramoyl-pentapeptide-transferase [Hydrogenoanaerobacterium saccharovorans]MBM6922183.1 phospho-N-acetylmuramoyl-pentapeptide-transferase [Hydrogenoanaerobacterium saccharovorans]